MNSPDYADDLERTVREAALRLVEMDPEHARIPRAEGKWAPIQIIGHLIDSASNNHGRFVRAGLGGGLRMGGYAQEEWVELHQYRSADWVALVELWRGFNLLIARVMRAVPEEIRTALTADHDLDRSAWEVVETGTPTSLDYFMQDYVGHLKHHLRQIDPELADAPVMQNPDSRIKTT